MEQDGEERSADFTDTLQVVGVLVLVSSELKDYGAKEMLNCNEKSVLSGQVFFVFQYSLNDLEGHGKNLSEDELMSFSFFQ